jgi:hypothetical protein
MFRFMRHFEELTLKFSETLNETQQNHSNFMRNFPSVGNDTRLGFENLVLTSQKSFILRRKYPSNHLHVQFL